MSLKVGTGGNPLRSFFAERARFAGGVTGTGTVLGPWEYAARLKIKKQIPKKQDFEGYPSMCGLTIENSPPGSKLYRGTSRRK
jgi:hypothetical protein